MGSLILNIASDFKSTLNLGLKIQISNQEGLKLNWPKTLNNFVVAMEGGGLLILNMASDF